MTFLELAKTIMNEAKTPLAPTEIWQTAVDKGYDKQLNSYGKTPWATLYTEIYVSVRDNPKSPFQATDSRPKKFFLKSHASQLDFNKKDPRQIREDYNMPENFRKTTGHLRDEEIDVLAFVYIAQNIRREGVLKKNVADDYRFPKKYLENLIQNGEIEEKRAVRYFDAYTTTRKGNELIKSVIVARLENTTSQIKSILDSFREGVLRYLIEQVALSDFDEGRSLKDRSEEKNFINYNEYAFSLLNDDRLKSFRDNLFNEFEDMGLAVKVNDYVSTEGGKIRDKYFVLAPELEEYFKEYLYALKFKKPLFLPQHVKMIELFNICQKLTISTHSRSSLEYEVKNKPISGNEAQDAVDELINEGLIIVKNDQLRVSDKHAYQYAIEERFIKPVVDYLLAKQPVVQEIPPTASVEESRIEGNKPNKIEADERQIQAVSQETIQPSALIARQAQHTGLKVFLGLLKNNNEKTFWQPGSLNNGHFILIGGSGAGKTETLRCIASDLDKNNFPVLMIDFHGDMTCKGENIKTYEIGERSRYYFNPLELNPSFKDITPLRAGSDFVDAMSINFSELGVQQRNRLKEIIKEAYDRNGITREMETWDGELNFAEVEEVIKNTDDKLTQTTAAYLNDIFDYKLFSGSEKISISDILDNGITHINLKSLPESLRALYADLFLRKIYYSLQALGEIQRGDIEDRNKFRLFVIVDEAKLLVSEKQGVKAVLNKYATELRKYGGGLILASQLIDHFTDEIRSNIAVKLCMKAENNEQAKKNSKSFGVDEELLLGISKGEGILSVDRDKLQIKIVPTWER